MKPGKPSKVEFMLFPAAGSAYIKTFNAGTERTKYSFPVPSFGAKNMAGAFTIREPAKRPAVYLNPCIRWKRAPQIRFGLTMSVDMKTEEQAPAVYISGDWMNLAVIIVRTVRLKPGEV